MQQVYMTNPYYAVWALEVDSDKKGDAALKGHQRIVEVLQERSGTVLFYRHSRDGQIQLHFLMWYACTRTCVCTCKRSETMDLGIVNQSVCWKVLSDLWSSRDQGRLSSMHCQASYASLSQHEVDSWGEHNDVPCSTLISDWNLFSLHARNLLLHLDLFSNTCIKLTEIERSDLSQQTAIWFQMIAGRFRLQKRSFCCCWTFICLRK